MTFTFIAENTGAWPVAWMCDALDMSESGSHAWVARSPSPAEQRGDLVAAIEAIHADIRGRYGSPRMTAELNARGHPCSENTAAKLMREHGIRATAPRRVVQTTDSNHLLPVHDNLLDLAFAPRGPNASWCADITYVPPREGGCTCPSWWACSAGWWSGGRWPRRPPPAWWSTPWRGPWSVAPEGLRDWSPIRTAGASTRVSTTAAD